MTQPSPDADSFRRRYRSPTANDECHDQIFFAGTAGWVWNAETGCAKQSMIEEGRIIPFEYKFEDVAPFFIRVMLLN